MKDNPLFYKSFQFAIKIVGVHKSMLQKKREYIFSKQLIKCGTSIGANVAEANGAISKSDFSAKISIAYKESLEVKYWLKLLRDTEYLSVRDAESLINEADELSKIMFAILKTTRIKKN
ncbi:MAG: four helix bundle protein [Flavobacteriaceae bacterium]